MNIQLPIQHALNKKQIGVIADQAMLHITTTRPDIVTNVDGAAQAIEKLAKSYTGYRLQYPLKGFAKIPTRDDVIAASRQLRDVAGENVGSGIVDLITAKVDELITQATTVKTMTSSRPNQPSVGMFQDKFTSYEEPRRR